MKKAIVTGANGFLGRALCRALNNAEVEVVALVRDKTRISKELMELSNVVVLECCATEYKHLGDIISTRNADVCFHLAWSGVSGEYRGNLEVQLDSVRWSCELLKSCSEIGCKRFVFASTIMEFELQEKIKAGKNMTHMDYYACAKNAAHNFFRIIACSCGIHYERLIISNVYGPGELSQRLICTSLVKILRGEQCEFTTGEQMYDFVYIDDAIKAIFAVGECGRPGKSYYIGSLNPRPLKEFLTELAEVLDKRDAIKLGAISGNGISLNYDSFDLLAVKRDTGVVPEVDFKSGIKRTVEWMQETGIKKIY